MKIKNKGIHGQVVSTTDGTITIVAGSTVEVDKKDLQGLDGHMLDHYYRRGVTFEGMPAPCIKADAADENAAEKAAKKRADVEAKAAAEAKKEAENARIKVEEEARIADENAAKDNGGKPAANKAPAPGRGGNAARNNG